MDCLETSILIFLCGMVDYVHVCVLLGRHLAIYMQRHMEEILLPNRRLNGVCTRNMCRQEENALQIIQVCLFLTPKHHTLILKEAFI